MKGREQRLFIIIGDEFKRIFKEQVLPKLLHTHKSTESPMKTEVLVQ